MKHSKALFLLPLIARGIGSAVALADEVPWAERWDVHFQATTVTQMHGDFSSPYAGADSLQSKFEIPSSFTSTLFVGHPLWRDAVVFVNPEEQAGSGLSGTHGLAAFPNGEIYRVDDPSAKTNLSRLFIQQDFELGGGDETFVSAPNQLRGVKNVERITIVAGKFSLNDYFDDNTYSHDPRSQFLNWALMDNLAWDYAADTRGYTWGIYGELHLRDWSFRLATVQEPAVANSEDLEGDIMHAHGDNAEIEYRYRVAEQPGVARLLGYMNHAHMGSYRESIQLAQATGAAPDITQTEAYRTKYGAGLNLEQAITPELGLFSRIGWDDGATETWAFTEADRAFTLGASLRGDRWSRSEDTLGVAAIVDLLAKDHADYLSAGGAGFMLGDGRLNYAPEEILEVYYLFKLRPELSITPDFQFAVHPGYNADRGPVPIYALRLHCEL